MTDQRRSASIDSVLRRLDVPATPDESFVRSSATLLRRHAQAARARDRSALERLRGNLRGSVGVTAPFHRIAILGTVILTSAMLLAVLLVLFGGSRPRLPAPFGLAGNGRIAFVKGYHIYTSDPSGGDIRQLTFGDGGESEPRYSPDGTRVAYWQWHKAKSGVDPSAHDVVVAAADGSHPVVVARGVTENVPGRSHIAWSPDSQFVSFSGSTDGGATSGGYVVSADGSSGVSSIGSFGGTAYDPTWAPDGKRLVIVADSGLWVVDRDGSNGHLVMRHDAYQEIGSRGQAAEWSADGTTLLFTAITLDARQGVYVLPLDGSGERNISGDVFRARDASWAPDGSRIAYMRTGAGTGPHCVVSDPTGHAIRDLGGAYGWYQPVWSPDGTRVVVTDDRPGPGDNPDLPAVRVVLDAVGSAPPIEIPAPGPVSNGIPDWAATWQRVAP